MSQWLEHSGSDLAQGDLLPDCQIPIIDSAFGQTNGLDDRTQDVSFGKGCLVIVTQTCDLVNHRSQFAALCPVFGLEEFERLKPGQVNGNNWENVRRGRHEGLHMLASPADPGNNRNALIVDFRTVYSLPLGYVSRRAQELGKRWRLQSPFREHFSQAFARYFMRIALPDGSEIPRFK